MLIYVVYLSLGAGQVVDSGFIRAFCLLLRETRLMRAVRLNQSSKVVGPKTKKS